MARTIETEVIDGNTGEVMEGPSALSRLDMSNTKAVLAKLREADSADSKAFEVTEYDFWKPGQADHPTELTGMYGGFEYTGKQKNRKTHMLVRESAKVKGKLVRIRFNGKAQLNNLLEPIPIGTRIRVRYTGQRQAVIGGEGESAMIFEVFIFKKDQEVEE